MPPRHTKRDAARRPGVPAAVDGTVDPDPVVGSLSRELTAAALEFARRHHVPGASIGIVREGRLAWSLGIGHADRTAARMPDERTIYRVASISKTFTATAILQLRDKGRLRLDDPVVRTIPELIAVANPFGPIEDVTIRRLLMHTSGLQGEEPSDDPDAMGEHLAEDIPALLGSVRVVIPPESAHKYCNLGYILLGIVVERLSGRPFATYVRRNLTRPLGMEATSFDPFRRHAARVAVGYDHSSYSDELPAARRIPTDRWLADGGLWSSVEDLSRWILQQFRREDRDLRGPGQVLDGRSLREMQRPSYLSDSTWTEAQGLGWYATRLDDCVLTGHSGSLDGFRTNISFSLPDELGVIVLTNGAAAPAELSRKLVGLVLPAHRTARSAARPLELPEPMPASYRELLGTYRDQESGDDVSVEWRSRQLWMVVPDEPDGPFALEATDDPLVFAIRGGRSGGEPMRFLRGPNGEVDRCNAAGYPLTKLVPARAPGRPS
jgi:D-alanyl-D-alanine carboxypeptidase